MKIDPESLVDNPKHIQAFYEERNRIFMEYQMFLKDELKVKENRSEDFEAGWQDGFNCCLLAIKKIAGPDFTHNIQRILDEKDLGDL
jgi:hypothetical protein